MAATPQSPPVLESLGQLLTFGQPLLDLLHECPPATVWFLVEVCWGGAGSKKFLSPPFPPTQDTARLRQGLYPYPPTPYR